MTEAEQVAVALPLAQRRMILRIDRGQPREFGLGTAGFALMRKGLVFVNELGARHLTDEGHAVREILCAMKPK